MDVKIQDAKRLRFVMGTITVLGGTYKRAGGGGDDKMGTRRDPGIQAHPPQFSQHSPEGRASCSPP